MSMISGIVPSLFKMAIVHPIYKGHGKNPRDLGSYRPIAILPPISKVLEVAVREALLLWFQHVGFLPESQYGFLPGRYVAMALSVAQNDWIHAKSKNEIVGVMTFDLSSVFDTLDHSTLLSKLKSAGISGVPLKWFESYLQGCSQSVPWNSVRSESRPIERGVPQGSILGPLLFLAMIHDLPKCLTSDTSTTSSRVAGYAYDTTLYVKAKNSEHLILELERLANIMVCYCNDNSLILNGQKTQILTSARRELEIRIGNDLVSSSQTISLLGLQYDKNFSTAPYLLAKRDLL